MRSIALEEGRREAGRLAVRVPVRVSAVTPRDQRSILELSFDVSQVNFSLDSLPAMPMAGDVLGIFPKNTPEDIAGLKRCLKEEEAEKIFLKGRYEKDEGQYYAPEEALEIVSLNPVKIELLQTIEERLNALESIPSQWLDGSVLLQEALTHLAHETQTGNERLMHTHAGDILEAFPGLVSLQELCEIQGGIYRRVYTLAGIDRKHNGDPTTLRILLATGVSYSTPIDSFGQGNIRQGICSSYLQRVVEAEDPTANIEVFVQRRRFGSPEKDRMYLPYLNREPDEDFLAKLQLPLLLIAAGSGISGIHTILEERWAWKQKGYKVGKGTLVFGLRNRHTDYLLEEELEQFLERGLLDRIELAESRPLKGRKKYVQHLLMEGGLNEELQEVKHGRRSLVLCGDRKMGQGVLHGCLPFIFAGYPDSPFAESLFDLPMPTLEAIFLKGQKQVIELKAQGIIRASASGTRYAKTELTCEDALEGLRKMGLESWKGLDQQDELKLPRLA